MHKLLLILIALLFLEDFVPTGKLKLVPELISAMIFAFILLRAALYNIISIPPRYLILGVFILLHGLVGIMVNSVAPGTIVTGLRPYLRWLPLMLLPTVYQSPDSQFRNQLLLMLCFLLLQAPVTLYQRLIEYRDYGSGDMITGTLGVGGSGALSVLLLSGIAVLTAFYARGMISGAKLFMLVVILTLPTTINETKATFVLLPFAILVPYLFAGWQKINVAKLTSILTILAVLFGGYITLYNQFYKEQGVEANGEKSLWDNVARYLYGGREWTTDELIGEQRIGRNTILPEDPIGSKEGGGRIDKILMPIRTLSYDPVKLWVGLGFGNASTSTIGQFSGEFAIRIGEISGETTASFLLWETGLGGIALFLVLLGFLTYDAIRLSKLNDARGTLAAGWVGVMLIMIICVAYLNMFYFNALSYLWAYLSGHIIAWRFMMKKQPYALG